MNICCGNCQTLLKTLHAHPLSPKSCVFAAEMRVLLLCPLKTKFSHHYDGLVRINLFIFIQLAFISVRHMNHHGLMSPKQICFYQPVISLLFFSYIYFSSNFWASKAVPDPPSLPFPLSPVTAGSSRYFRAVSQLHPQMSSSHVATWHLQSPPGAGPFKYRSKCPCLLSAVM